MLDQYLKELQKITLLQPQEERALWIAYKDDGCVESRGRLIEQYQPLVFREVMRWNMGSDMVQDALQEGTVGLIEAVERYEYQRNIAFPLFAVHRIRGRIIDYLNREGKSGMVSMQSEMAKKQEEIQKGLKDKVDSAVNSVASTKSLSLVVDKRVVLYGGTDITDQVAKKLSESKSN